jgi:hypothetical protein
MISSHLKNRKQRGAIPALNATVNGTTTPFSLSSTLGTIGCAAKYPSQTTKPAKVTNPRISGARTWALAHGYRYPPSCRATRLKNVSGNRLPKSYLKMMSNLHEGHSRNRRSCSNPVQTLQHLSFCHTLDAVASRVWKICKSAYNQPNTNPDTERCVN